MGMIAMAAQVCLGFPNLIKELTVGPLDKPFGSTAIMKLVFFINIRF